MTKTILVHARRCCWLPLAALCMVLPARADTMTVTVNPVLTQSISDGILDSTGTFSLNAFDTSLGTLTEVDLFAEIGGTYAISNIPTGPGLNISASLEDDPSIFLGFGGPLPGPAGNIAYHGSQSITGDLFLADFLSLSDWSVGTLVDVGALPPGATFSSDQTFDVRVTYDYTPLFASTPEPASLFLLGTISACAWAIRKRRPSLKRQQTN
jgi:hypothetical protein